MQSSEIRQKFLDFFARHDHTIVPSSSLIPDDPSVLLTTAGMQQFKKYYTGEADPIRDFGRKNTVSVQKSFRTSDIDEVGDERHLTFFEMLGNFSFGGYFKERAIQLAHEFLTKEVGLEISYVTVFEGLESIDVPEDTESQKIWRSIDPDIKIIKQGMDDVFWGPTGSAGPCGPTTEIYCKNGVGQDVEIWNIVFNEFFFPGSREELLAGTSRKKLEPLPTPGVDTGMGLERLVMSVQKTKTIFETDLFESLMQGFPNNLPVQAKRVIADHIRAVVFLISDGLRPSNKEAGYILRRLLRRVIAFAGRENIKSSPEYLLKTVVDVYKTFPDYKNLDFNVIAEVYKEEYAKFLKTLTHGFKYFNVYARRKREGEPYTARSDIAVLSGKDAFDLYQNYGFPLEVIRDLAQEKKIRFSENEENEFREEFKKHQEISRAGSIAKFGGHGLYMKTGEVTIRDESEVEKVTRLHTATHLMHAALRSVLGPEVRQDGSDITVERTRFDFRFGRKVTLEELKQVEQWVNDAVGKNLTVQWEEMPYEEAINHGALGFFHEKYPVRVKVYTMFDPNTNEVYSKELCGGPHVTHTSEVGHFRIIKEESSSAGVRRIRGVVE